MSRIGIKFKDFFKDVATLSTLLNSYSQSILHISYLDIVIIALGVIFYIKISKREHDCASQVSSDGPETFSVMVVCQWVVRRDK